MLVCRHVRDWIDNIRVSLCQFYSPLYRSSLRVNLVEIRYLASEDPVLETKNGHDGIIDSVNVGILDNTLDLTKRFV